MNKNSKYEISYSPKPRELDEIKDWLSKEAKGGNGFIYNWDNVILKACQRNNMIIISNRKKVVGIRPLYRKKGVGRFLIQTLFSHLNDKGFKIVDLQCNPPESEVAWRKLGFVDFPKGLNSHFENQTLYKIIVPSLECIQVASQNEVLELWDEDEYRAFTNDPKWRWELIFKDGTRELVKPIICPSCSEWGIKWRKGDSPIKKDKVKHFISEGSEAMDNFLVITSLP